MARPFDEGYPPSRSADLDPGPDLTESLEGRTLDEARRWIETQLREERANYDRFMHDALALGEAISDYVGRPELYVEGSLRTQSWDDKQSGQKRYRTEVNANDVQFLDSRQDGAPAATAGTPSTVPEPAAVGGDVDPDDIPF